MTSPLLCVRGVKTYYGSIAALKGVDIEVDEGEIAALIGANGAGKSTLMMTICGDPRAREGSISFADRDITRLPTHEIARLRIAQSPAFKDFCVRQSMYVDIADRRQFLTELPKEDAHWKRVAQLSKES